MDNQFGKAFTTAGDLLDENDVLPTPEEDIPATPPEEDLPEMPPEEVLPDEEEESGFQYFLRLVYRLRGLLLSIPVAVVAIIMAVKSAKLLPEKVGIFMLANGHYQFYIGRPMAIVIPLVLTAICITITLCAKKVTFPWMISLFSLLLPTLLWLTSALTS